MSKIFKWGLFMIILIILFVYNKIASTVEELDISKTYGETEQNIKLFFDKDYVLSIKEKLKLDYIDYDTKIFIYDFPWPEAYSDNSNLKEAIIFYNDLIKKVVDKFPNVYFLENNNLFLSHENFIDPLHVNNLGAEIISRQLSYELNKR